MHLYYLVESFLRSLFRREEGQTMAEYALILVLIAIVVIVTLVVMGDDIAQVFTNISNELQNPGGGS